jgi:hypothetical protein
VEVICDQISMTRSKPKRNICGGSVHFWDDDYGQLEWRLHEGIERTLCISGQTGFVHLEHLRYLYGKVKNDIALAISHSPLLRTSVHLLQSDALHDEPSSDRGNDWSTDDQAGSP